MWGSIKNLILDFRETIWPLLDPIEERPPRLISETDCEWNENETDLMLEYVEKYQESEEKRNRDVESKSTIFIATFGVATTVLISLIKDMILDSAESHTLIKLFLICMMTLSIIYMCRAIWFSVKVLERRTYYVMGFPNFMLNDCAGKKKQLVLEHYNNTKKNQDTINIKVDYMTMAQEYFKRAIVVVALFSGVVFSNYILGYGTVIKDILTAFESLNINQITLIGFFVGLFILFVLVVILFHKIMKLERVPRSN